jgi:hypothetical protein
MNREIEAYEGELAKLRKNAVSKQNRSWTVIVEEASNGDDLFIPLSDDMITSLGWEENDVLEWKDNEDGSFTLTKKAEQTEWVLVDTISQYRMRYLVEVPAGKTQYALDTVSFDEAKEFNQEWLGETIVSHHVITEQEGLDLFRSDEPILAGWDDDTIKRNCFTFWVEDDE